MALRYWRIAALNDGHGVTGIASNVQIGVSAASGITSQAGDGSNGTRPAAIAINNAVPQMRRGDIILIEQHFQGPSAKDAATTVMAVSGVVHRRRILAGGV